MFDKNSYTKPVKVKSMLLTCSSFILF